jgi:segregation and condensation protein A
LRSPELDLEVYQGPFDLLLSLIMKEEVDLLEVPLLQVITAYLEDMESAGVIGYWDDMTEFLLLMSLLIEVKSRMLLPEAFLPFEEEELTPEQARDQLLDRLFVYSQFKAAAQRLRDLGEISDRSVMRGAQGHAKIVLTPEEEIAGSGDLTELRDTLVRVLAHRGDPDTSHLPDARVQLRNQIGAIKRLLASAPSFSFNRSFGGEQPLVQALTVFALLDMLSRGEVKVQQAQVFGDILVKRTDTSQPHRGGE